MQTIAVGSLAASTSHRAGLWTALVAAGAFLPIGILGPIGGAWADRLDRRRWLIVGNVVQALLAAGLAGLVAAGHTQPALLTGVVTLQGAVSALVLPFQAAILPDLVQRDELLAGAALNSAQFNLGRVFGPALAGAVVAAFGYSTAFVVNSVSFLAVVIAMLFIRLPPPPRLGSASLRGQIAEGLAATRREPACRSAVVVIAIVAVLVSPFIALVPAMARHLVPHRVPTGTAVLTTAQGAGAVIGALSLAALARAVGRGTVLLWQLAALGIVVAAYALAPSLWLAALAITVVGATYIGVLSGLQTVVQLRAPDAYRGRILGFYLVALGVMYPIGALIQGAIADELGLAATEAWFAMALVVVLAALAVARRGIVAALRAEVVPSS